VGERVRGDTLDGRSRFSGQALEKRPKLFRPPMGGKASAPAAVVSSALLPALRPLAGTAGRRQPDALDSEAWDVGSFASACSREPPSSGSLHSAGKTSTGRKNRRVRPTTAWSRKGAPYRSGTETLEWSIQTTRSRGPRNEMPERLSRSTNSRSTGLYSEMSSCATRLTGAAASRVRRSRSGRNSSTPWSETRLSSAAAAR
jgi:hypothetical protein